MLIQPDWEINIKIAKHAYNIWKKFSKLRILVSQSNALLPLQLLLVRHFISGCFTVSLQITPYRYPLFLIRDSKIKNFFLDPGTKSKMMKFKTQIFYEVLPTSELIYFWWFLTLFHVFYQRKGYNKKSEIFKNI